MKIVSVLPVGLLSLALLAACADRPITPSVAVMPPPNKPFDVFQEDDVVCRNYASASIGGNRGGEQSNGAATGAAIGTLGGAAAGAAIGSASGQLGAGAAIGAGLGLLTGAAIGSSEGGMDRYQQQRKYDLSYEQCMYSRGNQVPGYGYAQPRSAPFMPPPPPPPSR